MFRRRISSLWDYHKTREIPNWYILYLFHKAYLDRDITIHSESMPTNALLDKAEAYHATIQKEVDDWFFETNSIERQKLNLPPKEQAITLKRFGRGEKYEVSTLGYVDPEYLVRLDRTIHEQSYLYGETPKMSLLEQVLMFCSYRCYSKFWDSVNMEERFWHWMQARQGHARILAERDAHFAVMREQNQASKQDANSGAVNTDLDNDGWIQAEKNPAERVAERLASLVMLKQNQAHRQAETLNTVLDSGGWIQARENPAEILAERQVLFVALREQNQARRQMAVKTVSDEDNGGWT